VTDVFLLGAGFSRAISDNMPLLSDLTALIREQLIARPGRVRPEDRKRQLTYLQRLFGNDFEMWLTYLSQSHPWLSDSDNTRNWALYLDLSRVVATVIDTRSREVTQNPPPDWLSELFLWWCKNPVTVLTMNYDTLVEQAQHAVHSRPWKSDEEAMEYIKTATRVSPRYHEGVIPLNPVLPFDDDARDEIPFRLLKLHGSTNWYYSGSSSYGGEPISYIGPDSWTCNVDESKQKAPVNKLKTPFIVPPVSEKGPYFAHDVVRAIWTEAAGVLQQASRVFCLGYSLPATDTMLRMFLLDNQPINRVPLYIVNRDRRQVKHYKTLLKGSRFAVDGRYVHETDPIPKFVASLLQDEMLRDVD